MREGNQAAFKIRVLPLLACRAGALLTGVLLAAAYFLGSGRDTPDKHIPYESGVVPTVRLTEIFRQAASSQIIVNAHRINKGEMPITPKGAELSDFYFVPAQTPEEIALRAREMVEEVRGYPHIYSTADAVLPGTPPGNFLALIRSLRAELC